MNHELAKLLKEAGFEQKKRGFFFLYIPERKWPKWYENFKPILPSYWKYLYTRNADAWINEHYYAPSLSEIIEAIGPSFRWLKQGNTHLKGHKWHTSAKGITKLNEEGRKIKEKDFRGTGETPEEALVNLYLSIKKEIL